VIGFVYWHLAKQIFLWCELNPVNNKWSLTDITINLISARFIGVLLVFMFVFCGNGCGGHVSHKVQSGETLYAIGWKYGQDTQDIANWNNLAPPYRIRAGQWLRVAPRAKPWWEEAEQTVKSSTPPKKVIVYLPESNVKTIEKKHPQIASTNPYKAAKIEEQKIIPSQPSAASQQQMGWQWPTSGRVIKKFSTKPPRSKGIDIAGKRGQPIFSAAEGDVVYIGGGLIGYGKLIIIKHNKTFLSAYAHNDEILVEEGDKVKKGQFIAKMGSTSDVAGLLHFEIRRNGNPVNPLRLLRGQ